MSSSCLVDGVSARRWQCKEAHGTGVTHKPAKTTVGFSRLSTI